MKKSQQIGLGLAGVAFIGALGTWIWTGQPKSNAESELSRNNITQHQKQMHKILDNDRAYPDRIQSVRKLPLNVEDADLKKLLAYLEAPLPEEGRGDALVALNEIMEQLRLRGRATHEYGICLTRIMLSSSSDEVVRDYAVQHAIGWMIDSERMAELPGKEDATVADREMLLGAIASVLQEANLKHGSAWGTTLNALRDFRQRTGSPDEIGRLFEESGDLIRSVAKAEKDSYQGNRVAAIQSLAELKDRTQSHAIVRALLDDKNTPIYAQLPAIASLGLMGSAGDKEFLDHLASGDRRMSHAAESAKRRIEERILREESSKVSH